MTIRVGEVIAVHGVKIVIRIFDESSKDTLYHHGEKYKGVSIREYISIQRGFRDIICIIEGEFLDENKFEESGERKSYLRKVEARPIGYFEENNFREGIKFLPMIKDQVFLVEEGRISEIYGRGSKDAFVIGEMLKEEIPIALPWQKLFNSHIGIFGNTGSGKSNTLAKLYTVLFDQKAADIKGKSKFFIMDFNGEYAADQFLPKDQKTILNLNTATKNGAKFHLNEDDFWNTETLSILFQATANTQKPFINRLVNGRKRFSEMDESFLRYLKKTFKAVFTVASPKPDSLDLLRNIAVLVGADEMKESLREVSWHSKHSVFFKSKEGIYFDSEAKYENEFGDLVNNLSVDKIDGFDELIIRANIQLTRELINGYVQYEHIQPLLKRMESSLSGIRNVVSLDEKVETTNLITVISLRKCNQEIKKILPLLIAKHIYEGHKALVKSPPDRTLHLIIDEAHNILSEQSARESESWKDYRLELFEEIIKEGRKFGIYITLSSQRPADISTTIISQLHNYFIHRLVNDRDLHLLDNTINTLDGLSRSLIPNLSKGCCVITGTSFDLPMVLQIHQLTRDKQPDSEDVDLEKLWRHSH